MIRFAPLIFTIALASCVAREITARHFDVTRVIDGDTFRIMYDGNETSVRMWGIDAPERNQPGGAEATAALRQLIEGRRVRISFPDPQRKRDNFGRLLCRVYVDGVDVGEAMVRTGAATIRK